MDETSVEIVELGKRLLGPDNFSASSVPYEQVSNYYQAADCFVLASLQEGFGRVYLEALMHGLPVIAHRHPVIEYVVGNEGVIGDLSRSRELAGLLDGVLAHESEDALCRRRWQSVRDRFSWDALANDYRAMFAHAASADVPPHFITR